ncbi:hypothetical protein DP73_03930 [Desulfosporosinus sp. HMP52]|uniref:GNAT family N-acetyltransferase n=1 Tax=Desulfosporosinus sp. HMP52 TaxID=1487923 RepID=UPI00051FD2CC|nr:GNAT family N-acetyltransferase [Desulfosporosinus sp. HMP52]KGK91417.1 hypothetical protein DP73_03930 [Desulfosporosinus sp. HMP52]
MDGKDTFRNLYGESFEAYESPWDTDYFGVYSAKVILKAGMADDESAELIDFLSIFDFVTIINFDNNKLNNYWLGKNIGIYLADINVQFTKNIDSCFESESRAEVFEAYQYDDRVLEIARRAFKYSRFFNDPNLPRDKAKRIYAHWAENAFAKTGRYYALAKHKGEISGFALFSVDPDISLGTIELLAVDEDCRGVNAGKSLIAGMENSLKQMDIRNLNVGTQADNSSAMKFYMTCGFRPKTCNSVYHYWPKISNQIAANSQFKTIRSCLRVL